MWVYTLDVIGFIVNHWPHPCGANGQQGDLLSHLKGQIAVCGKSALQIQPLAISLSRDPTVAPAITNNYRVNFDLLFPNVFLCSERPSQRLLRDDLFIFHRRIHRSSNPAALQRIYGNKPGQDCPFEWGGRSKPDTAAAINMEIVWLSGNAGCSSGWTGEWKREHKNKNFGWHTREKQEACFWRCLFEFSDSNLLHPEVIAVSSILPFFLSLCQTDFVSPGVCGWNWRYLLWELAGNESRQFAASLLIYLRARRTGRQADGQPSMGIFTSSESSSGNACNLEQSWICWVFIYWGLWVTSHHCFWNSSGRS